MDEITVKKIVWESLQKGMPLPEIQELLEKEHDYKIKFMDLRILASDLDDVDWAQFDPKAPVKEPDLKEDSIPNAPPATGKTDVTVSPIARPGCTASGTVTFASGGSAEWVIDYQGRPGFDKMTGTPPSEADVREFITQLQTVLGGGAR